jgi:hypothetical protein
VILFLGAAIGGFVANFFGTNFFSLLIEHLIERVRSLDRSAHSRIFSMYMLLFTFRVFSFSIQTHLTSKSNFQ